MLFRSWPLGLLFFPETRKSPSLQLMAFCSSELEVELGILSLLEPLSAVHIDAHSVLVNNRNKLYEGGKKWPRRSLPSGWRAIRPSRRRGGSQDPATLALPTYYFCQRRRWVDPKHELSINERKIKAITSFCVS